MSRDGLFPALGHDGERGRHADVYARCSRARLRSRSCSPGTFNSVIAVAAFFFVLNYVVSFAAVFKLRRTMPDAPRPYRAWGYPCTTGFSLLGGTRFSSARS